MPEAVSAWRVPLTMHARSVDEAGVCAGDVIRNISCVMLGNFPADTFLKRYFTYEMTVSASHPSVTVAYSVFIFLDSFIVVAANWMG